MDGFTTGNIDIEGAGVTDVTNYATATVPEAKPYIYSTSEYVTENNSRKWRKRGAISIDNVEGDIAGYIDVGTYYGTYDTYNAIPTGTSVTPTESTQTIGGANVMMEGAVTVNAIPSNYVGSGITQRTSSDLTADRATVTVPSGYYSSDASKTIANSASPELHIAQNISPTISVSNTGLITATVPDFTALASSGGYIEQNVYVDDIILANESYNYQSTHQLTTRTSSDLTASGATVTAPAGYYASNATKTIASGTAGTPTATKGSVSNHSISVTPSVTNTTGYITGSTINGTAVTVSASELVSGSQTVTTNDTYDVTNLAELVVNVSGGGSSSMTIGTKTATLSSSASSISFTGLSGNPLSFVVTSSADQSTGGTKAVAVAYDGTSFHGMDVTTQAEADTGFTKSYSSGTLTITATSATFEANEYKLVYAYGGSSSDIHTADVQVGSGATSITFSSLSGRPLYFSCVFKSSFSTSSGYQRVIDVVNDGTNTYGHAFDSSAKAQTSWSYTYSGGNLTISSTGTNNGGYFHQPGYYQLTYAVDPNAVQYETVSKTYRASTSAQSEKIEPSTGYDAMSEVNISIPAVSQTNLTAGNIKSGTTISISNGSTNLWSVTGTYTGGGGGTSMNAQSHQSTSRSTSTTATSLNSLTCSTTGTYTVTWTCTRSSTSGSWSSQLYVGGTASGSSQTTWSNHVQTVTLTNVSISANQTVAVYGVSRGSNYYIYAPQLTIIQTS